MHVPKGSTSARPPFRIFRLGIVGAGTMGRYWASGAARGLLGPRVSLAAICDADAVRAEAAGNEYAVPHYMDVANMLERERPDAVYIAVPDAAHRDPFIVAAQHGVAVLVEKPFATTIDDAEAMLQSVRETRIVAEVNFSNRWNPPFIAAKRAIVAGELGDILTFSSRLNNAIVSPTKLLTWAGNTTPAWFLLSHTLDLARWLGGQQAECVWANGVKKKLPSLGVPTYDYIHAMVKYADGTDSFFESAWILPENMPSTVDFKFQIIGTDGAIYIDTEDQMIHKATSTSVYEYVSTLDWLAPRVHAFLDRIERDDRSLQAVEDGYENTRILVALHRSLETGKVVPVGAADPASESAST